MISARWESIRIEGSNTANPSLLMALSAHRCLNATSCLILSGSLVPMKHRERIGTLMDLLPVTRTQASWIESSIRNTVLAIACSSMKTSTHQTITSDYYYCCERYGLCVNSASDTGGRVRCH